MACSLQRMACFLKQRSLEGRNGNNIPQLELFGESAWDFICAIFESGWDQLYSSSDTSIRDIFVLEISRTTVVWPAMTPPPPPRNL